jgi:hypothetical protein
MSQAAGRTLVIDRQITHVAWDLDRAPGGPGAASAQDLDGLTRALTLAIPVSALFWIGGLAVLLSAIR